MNMKLPDRAVTDHQSQGGSRSIGEILIEAGRLSPEAAQRIAKAQAQHGLRFGEAAIRMQLLTVADIEFALARQFEYPYVVPEGSSIHSSVVAAYQPFGGVAEQMRSLRSRLLIRQLELQGTPSTISILSASAGEGRSFVAANLAVVFSQMGERTLLIDADMRRPVQHLLFGLSNQMGLSNMLLGRASFQDIRRVPDLLDLSVVTAGSLPPNPQELLMRPTLSKLISDATSVFDVVIVDTPPAASYADAQIVSCRTGSSLMVTRANMTDGLRLRRVMTSLRDSGANVVGSVMNEG